MSKNPLREREMRGTYIEGVYWVYWVYWLTRNIRDFWLLLSCSLPPLLGRSERSISSKTLWGLADGCW